MTEPTTKRELKLTRQGWADALIELGQNPDVVVLDADLSKSTLTCQFKEKYPAQFHNVGIAEQNLVNIAGGLSLTGYIPFVSTYGVFLSGRAWEMIRTTICINNLNVKFGGAHGGLSVGPDGASHQALEEIAIMRCLPNMTVVVPADYEETRKAILQSAKIEGPVYIRFGREKVPVISTPESEFEIGKANVLKEGDDITIIACGAMVAEALDAQAALAEKNISAEVINLHTIKPLDTATILKSLQKTKALVTVEEHQISGGMGSAVLEAIASENPVPAELIGVPDTFGESGTPKELLEKFGLKSSNIAAKAEKVIQQKQ